MDRPSDSTVARALRKVNHITCYLKPHWSTLALKKAILLSNWCWFIGLLFVVYLVYSARAAMLGYEQKYRLAIQNHEQDNRSAQERTKTLLSEVKRLQELNLYTSTQAIDFAKNMHLVMESGHGGQMNFLEMIVPEALRLQISHGIPAAATVAMAIYESNYGRSELATAHHNYFGIKAADPAWKGLRAWQPTRDRGQKTMAWFRCYPDLKSSILGYAEFLHSSNRYQEAFACRSGEKFVQAVLKAGYCPDQDYLQNVLTVMRRHHLNNLDLPETKAE